MNDEDKDADDAADRERREREKRRKRREDPDDPSDALYAAESAAELGTGCSRLTGSGRGRGGHGDGDGGCGSGSGSGSGRGGCDGCDGPGGLSLLRLSTILAIAAALLPDRPAGQWLVRGLVRGYRRWLTRFTPACPSTPSCSTYALAAVDALGVRHGLLAAAVRIGRCGTG